MRGACRNVALTCAYAVFDKDTTSCPTSGSNTEDTCINSVSEMFYNSLLCSDGEVYDKKDGKCFKINNCTNTSGTVSGDGVNTAYNCNCGSSAVLNEDGKCEVSNEQE